MGRSAILRFVILFFSLCTGLVACNQSSTSITINASSSLSSSITVSESINSFSVVSGKHRLGFTGTCPVNGASTANGQLSVTASGGTSLTASCTNNVLSGSVDFTPPSLAQLKTVSVSYGDSSGSNTLLLCPLNYLAVPAHTSLSVSRFCVAKYEMKPVTSNPLTTSASLYSFSGRKGMDDGQYALLYPDSRPDGTPAANVTFRRAISLCDKLNESGAGVYGQGSFQLMTFRQRKALSEHLVQVAQNWTSGVVGTESFYMGSSKLDAYSGDQSCGGYCGSGADYGAATFGTSSVVVSGAAASTYNESTITGYEGTLYSAANAVGSGKEQRRTLYFSNGQVIWDYTGNMHEAVRYTESDGAMDTGMADNDADTYNSRTLPQNPNLLDQYYNLTDNSWYFGTNGSSLNESLFLPISISVSNAYTSGLGAYGVDPNSITSIPIMGGGRTSQSFTGGGLYNTETELVTNGSASNIGFRCVSVPQ